MPIQFPNMMPVPSAEEHRPFLNQFSKALQLGLGFPRQLQHADLENALTQLQSQELKEKLPYIAKMLSAELGLKNQKLENPLLGMPGVAGQIGAAMWAAQHGDQDNYNPQNNEINNNPYVSDNSKGPALTYGGTMSPSEQQEYFKKLRERTGAEESEVSDTGVPGNQPINNQNLTSRIGRNYAKMITDSTIANLNSKIIDANLKSKQEQGYTWAHMTAETKNGIVAQGLGMGIDPAEMQQEINKGKTIKQIAIDHGLDPDNMPPAIYFPTTATKTRTQQVQQVGQELDYLSSAASALIKPYSDTFRLPLIGVISPKAFEDQLSNDPQKQKQYGRYLAGLALQNEINNGRVLLSGGRSGIEIIRDLSKKSMAGISQLSPVRLTQTMFDEAQKTIDKILQKGAKIRSMQGMSPLSQSSNKGDQSEETKLDFSTMSDEQLYELSGGK